MQEYVEGYQLKENESIWEHPKTGKKYIRREYVAKGRYSEEKELQRQSKNTEELFYYVAYKYPQYTLKDLYENIPVKQVVKLAEEAQREEAKWFLTFNNILNGPNVKGKNKKEYKDTITRLMKIVDPEYDEKKPVSII